MGVLFLALFALAVLALAGWAAYSRRGELKRWALGLVSPSASSSAPLPTLTPLPPWTPQLTPTPRPAQAVDPDEWADRQLIGMSLSQKVGQLLLVSVDGEALDPPTCTFIQELQPAGVFYRPENVVSPGRLRRFSSELQDCALALRQPVPLFVSIDHEGQYANRFGQAMTQLPDALAFGAAGDPSLAYQAALASGQELAYVGVNLVFGPVADVLVNPDNRVIARRVYGGDPQAVSAFVAQAVTGYRQAGLIPVLKHFPGHGGVAGDTHKTLPVDGSDRARLDAVYLPPFRSGLAAGAPAVMLSHVAFPNITGVKEPASLSEELIALLRSDLGFDGLVVTDALDMKAVSARRTVPEVSLDAVTAGVDLLLITSPEQSRLTYDYLLEAARDGRLPVDRLDEAVRRVLRVKAAHGLHLLAYPDAPEPDWDAGARLALEAGRRAVTLYQDREGWLPLSPAVRRILVISPNAPGAFSAAELDPAFKARGLAPEYVFYTPSTRSRTPQELDYLYDLPARARAFDLVILFTLDAHLDRVADDDPWQGQLALSLARSAPRLAVVALGSPTDLLEFPEIPLYLVTFGTTPGALIGLLDALTGSQAPTGKNPLPMIP